MKPSLIFCPQHRHTITTEVTARHGQDVCIRIRHQPTHHITQTTFGICTGVVKLINAHQRAIELFIRKFLEGITQRSMRTYQSLGLTSRRQKLLEAFHLTLFASALLTPTKVKVRCYLPIAEEPELLQFRILERTANTLFRNGYNGLAYALFRHLVESNEHHGTALPRCRWCFHQQVLLISGFVNLGLHFSHTEGIGSGG